MISKMFNFRKSNDYNSMNIVAVDSTYRENREQRYFVHVFRMMDDGSFLFLGNIKSHGKMRIWKKSKFKNKSEKLEKFRKLNLEELSILKKSGDFNNLSN